MWAEAAILILILATTYYFLISRKRTAPIILKTRRLVPNKITTTRTGKNYLITGGHGFLGCHMVEALLARGETSITILDLVPSHLFETEIAQGKVKYVPGNLCSLPSIQSAFTNIDTVFHAASVVDFWSRLPHQYPKFHAVNIQGTLNVIQACKLAGVKTLVYVSSATVAVPHDINSRAMTGKNEEEAGYPSAPFLSHYIQSKMQAEKDVLAANGTRIGDHTPLATVAVRPGGLFGPRDEWLASKIAQGAPVMNYPTAKQDFMYVENAVHALLLADEKVSCPTDPAAGHSFFVNSYVKGANPPTYHEWTKAFSDILKVRMPILSPVILVPLSILSEWVSRIFGGRVSLGQLDYLTPVAIQIVKSTYLFSDDKAQKLLGYKPPYSSKEAMLLSAAYFRPERQEEILKEYHSSPK